MYTAPQGWTLTTQILDRICEDLYLLKVGVSTALNMNDPTGVSARILWSCFQTHNVMAKYVEHSFENHPAMSAEYVKFLAANSGSEKVEKLEGLITSLSDKGTEASADTALLTGKKAEGAGSKNGALEGLITALTKRVKLLKGK